MTQARDRRHPAQLSSDGSFLNFRSTPGPSRAPVPRVVTTVRSEWVRFCSFRVEAERGLRGRCSTSTNLLPTPMAIQRSSSVRRRCSAHVRLTSCPRSDCADADADVVSRTLTAPSQGYTLQYRSAWIRTPLHDLDLDLLKLCHLRSEIPLPARARCRHPLREQLLLAGRNCSQCPSSPRAAAAIQFPVRRAAFRVRDEAIIASHPGGRGGATRGPVPTTYNMCVCPLSARGVGYAPV